MYDFYVLLGCFGITIDEFVCCTGAENIILKINTSLPDYNNMMNYFDQCLLFDRPMFDLNAVRHFIFNIQDKFSLVTKPVWSVKQFEMYQKYVIDHKHCGVYIKLKLPATGTSKFSKPTSSIEKDVVLIKKSSESLSKKLRLIRRNAVTNN